ncbi:MAG: AMP-binding protein, partial [Alphaproteobacteria bacterium]|nr:AMP-binding protein [Alphaproteobacteria bacterium]
MITPPTFGLTKALLRILFRLAYRVKIRGIENIDALKNQGVVFIANHSSLIDILLLAVFLPGRPVFAVSNYESHALWLRFLLALIAPRRVDPAKPLVLKSLANAAKKGRPIVIFPEGRLTTTGALMKIYEAPGVIASNAHVPLVPVRIDGAQYTPFSCLRGKVRLRLFPTITITLMPGVRLESDKGMTSRQRRQSFGDRLYDIMAEMIFATANSDQSLYEAILDASSINGRSTKILEDVERKPRSYGDLTTSSRILGRLFEQRSAPGERVGLLMDNGVGVTLMLLGLFAAGRIPAMLNFTAGLPNLRAACRAAQLKRLITSRRFVQLVEMQESIHKLSQEVEVLYLEDLMKSVGFWAKLRGFAESWFARPLYRRLGVKPNDPAVVLFTSGSEGMPKGVVLSHKNILANRHQMGTRIDLNTTDIMFNALPVFHSFGLLAGLMLPILSGMKAFLYPSPLHYRNIPELVYDTNATIMLGTDTFLSGYARMAHAYDFYSLRYIVAGAEKLKEDTRRIWFDKFGIRIFEGYGVSETSPVISVNTPMHYKAGTVGQLLPGMDYRLEPVEGITQGGRLWVRGANVMLGYLMLDKPGVLVPPPDGWHDTGDIAEVDEDGFLKIVGRAKRFAKVGGEMVSLNAVEAYVQGAYPEKIIAVVAAPDPRKGEQLILFTDSDAVKREMLVAHAHALHLSELMIPRQVIKLDQMPVLGTGKMDYLRLNQ